MKIIRSVPAIEVKRTFIVGNYLRGHKKEHRKKLSPKELLRSLAAAKRKVQKLNNAQLDRLIAKEWAKRRDVYNRMKWYIGFVKTSEVAVWRGAGGLPMSWTKGSLAQTGTIVATAIEKKSKRFKKRAQLAIPGILENSLEMVQKEKYLLPIILPPSAIKSCRGSFKKFRGDVDDGCMRSIALAVSGRKVIKAYIGKKK